MRSDDLIARAESLLQDGRPQEAADTLQPLIESGRAGLLARLAYVRGLASAGDDRAVGIARETMLLYPSVAAAALALGEALLRAGQLPTAIAEFQRALRIDPDLSDARYLLGCAWLEAGEPEKALQAFQDIPVDADTHGLAKRIAEAEQMRGLQRSNARYVRQLFDQFAADYDSRMLGGLAYSAPRILRELAFMVIEGLQSRSLNILDLGCGTGLAGVEFRGLARQLDGIDLSPAMISKARERGIYDHLHVSDVEGPLGKQRYDLVLAADTLVYLGDLSAVFASVHARLAHGGFFLFTVEREGDGRDFSLGPKRRWQHSEAYLRTLADGCGYAVAGFMICNPRTEAGIPVEGYALALQKLPQEGAQQMNMSATECGAGGDGCAKTCRV